MSVEVELVKNMLPASGREIIPIIVNVQDQDKTETLILDAQECAKKLSVGIKRFLGMSSGNDNADMKAKARALRVIVKGALVAFGPALLDALLGKERPRPGKKDDIVEWYADMFGKIGIALAVKNITYLRGNRDGNIVKVAGIDTQPNPKFSESEE